MTKKIPTIGNEIQYIGTTNKFLTNGKIYTVSNIIHNDAEIIIDNKKIQIPLKFYTAIRKFF